MSTFGFGGVSSNEQTIVNNYYSGTTQWDMDAENMRITNLANPESEQDAMTLNYFQNYDQVRDIATLTQVNTGTNDTTAISPLKLKQHIDAKKATTTDVENSSDNTKFLMANNVADIIGEIDTSDLMTLSGTQTITGTKTFGTISTTGNTNLGNTSDDNTTITGDLSVSHNTTLSGTCSVITPTSRSYAANRAYVDDNFVDKINHQTGIAGNKTFTGNLTITGGVNMNYSQLYNVNTPTDTYHAVNKQYADNIDNSIPSQATLTDIETGTATNKYLSPGWTKNYLQKKAGIEYTNLLLPSGMSPFSGCFWQNYFYFCDRGDVSTPKIWRTYDGDKIEFVCNSPSDTSTYHYLKVINGTFFHFCSSQVVNRTTDFITWTEKSIGYSASKILVSNGVLFSTYPSTSNNACRVSTDLGDTWTSAYYTESPVEDNMDYVVPEDIVYDIENERWILVSGQTNMEFGCFYTYDLSTFYKITNINYGFFGACYVPFIGTFALKRNGQIYKLIDNAWSVMGGLDLGNCTGEGFIGFLDGIFIVGSDYSNNDPSCRYSDDDFATWQGIEYSNTAPSCNDIVKDIIVGGNGMVMVIYSESSTAFALLRSGTPKSCEINDLLLNKLSVSGETIFEGITTINGKVVGNNIQTTSSGATKCGYYSGNSTAGNYTSNTFVGNEAGRYCDSSGNSSFFGNKCGRGHISNTNNDYRNTGAGSECFYNLDNADQNSGYGYRTGYYLTDGYNNSLFGNFAGFNLTVGHSNSIFGAVNNNVDCVLTTGNNCSLFGYQAFPNSSSASYQTVIGAQAVGDDNNQVMLGRNLDTVKCPNDLVVVGTTTISTPSSDYHASTKKYVDDNCVNLTGIQTITGTKTFSGNFYTQGNNTLGNSTSDDTTITGDLTVNVDCQVSGALTVVGGTTYTGSFEVKDMDTTYTDVIIGKSNMSNISTGNNQNVVIGNSCANNFKAGANKNIIIGTSCLSNSTNSLTGGINIVMGYFCGRAMTGSVANNIIMGYEAGYLTTTGSNNIFFGKRSGENNTTGGNCISIGNYSDTGATNNYSVAIGYQAEATASNQIMLGRTSLDEVVCGNDLKVLGDTDLTGGKLMINSHTPSDYDDIGVEGQIAYDNNYLYICIGTNNWRRISSSWA